MVNATNDAWYGQTIGPYQHFAIARVRAIEEGLPLVRAANTGISGIVDSVGRIRARLGLSKRGFFDSNLPGALPPTLFSRWGETPTWGLFFTVTLGLIVFGRTKNNKIRGKKIFKPNDSRGLKN
jgi:apolipoprotein N-acyltransferase